MAKIEEQIPEPTEDEIHRVQEVLTRVGGPHVMGGAQNILDVWVTERRFKADRLASARLMLATWVLAGATVVLALATIGLIFGSRPAEWCSSASS